MAAITASLVKELRERTGLGMMDCKKALVETDGDIEKAIEELRKSSGMKAAKKAGRTASDGLVKIRLSDDGMKAALVEVNCETDFAARDENFVAFTDTVINQVFDAGNGDVEALLDGGLEATREAVVQKIGENISVRRAEVLEVTEGQLASYVHSNGKIAVLVNMNGGDEELAKDVAMHIAATNPLVVSGEDMPEEVVAKEREIYTAQAQDSGKPPEIVEKMIDGRIRKFLAENALVDQPFVKDGDTKVGKLLQQNSASIISFVRYEVGEGIEVEEVDFAAEVAAQLGQ